MAFYSPDSGFVFLCPSWGCLRRRRIRTFRGPYVSTTNGLRPLDPRDAADAADEAFPNADSSERADIGRFFGFRVGGTAVERL